ncbi:helix-turn-helix transcriptional regulator [bacterium]|nr:helix-turn-helix transcriptional regulator [bacterium]
MQDEMSYNAKLANNIRTLRKKNKYSQEYLAELIDRTREHVNRLEKGKETIGFPTFIKLATVFNVSLDELAGFKTTKLF